jgi:hypothetical protein
MNRLRGVLVVTDAEDRSLRAVAVCWAAAGIRVTWLAGHGLPADETVDGVRLVRTRGSMARRACALAGRHDAVLVLGSATRLVARVAPVVWLVDEWPTQRWRPNGTVVVGSPAQRRALRADTGLRRPIFVVPPDPIERAADLLAGVLTARATATGRSRRRARPDLSTVVGFPVQAGVPAFRATDEVWIDGDRAVALLHGCDEEDARIAVARQHSTPTFVRLATDADLLHGPAATQGIG